MFAQLQRQRYANNACAGYDDIRALHNFIVIRLWTSIRARVLLGPLVELGKDHKSFGSGTNVIRGITGDQRELSIAGRVEHADIFRLDNLFSGYVVAEHLSAATDQD